jgi:hypothetical protein
VRLIQAYNVPMTPTREFSGALISPPPFLPAGIGNRLSHRATRQVVWQAARFAGVAPRRWVPGSEQKTASVAPSNHSPDSGQDPERGGGSVRKFFIVWTGQAFSLFGSALVQFALVWWLTKRTGSATVLATATLVALLPQVLAGPFIGVLVDR